jgi:hypothetical protein
MSARRASQAQALLHASGMIHCHLAPVLAMRVVSGVATMHQEVHERAGQQQHVWQGPEQVLGMVSPEEVAGDGDESADEVPIKRSCGG